MRCTERMVTGVAIWANDFGKALQSGAHLTELRRTKIGEFDVKDALLPEDFIKSLG